MARYIGPKTKIARKFDDPIYGQDKSYEKKKYPPGQHGNSRRRKKQSEYGLQLMEKQKAKYTYGILEKQFRNMFEKATRKTGITGEILLQLAESRLDNVVYRLLEIITESLAVRKNQFSWFEWDDANVRGKMIQVPTREEIPENIKEQLIVELYSK